ncbi:helix-turn-helix domain-containing protein [Neobacillus sp. LXY-1]|uniref:helix-turn-helix domain-containing protein n=1 Tax=Neobacillus sp. LXY-1 TaxID=3379133 RepID=UPI003EE29C8D
MIGSNIYKLRKKRGLTLSELAERANISKSYLSNIERNLNQNPSIQVIKKIAGVLDVELNELLYQHPEFDEPNADISEQELIELVNELKVSGIDKKEYKTLIEFIKWQNKTMGVKNN